MIKNLAIGSGSNRLLLIFALVLGLLCAILVGVYLSSQGGGSSSPATSTATVPVVVAAQDIPPLTMVTDAMLTVKNVPVADAIAGVDAAFSKTADVVGQTTQVHVTAGEQVLPSKVTSAVSAANLYGNNAPLSILLPTGQRAFSIEVSQVAAAGGLVRPGDHIDIISSKSNATNSDATQQPVTVTSCYVLQDVSVLVVGATLANPASNTSAAAIAGTLPDPNAKVMTVAVSPENAALLATAQQSAGDSVGQQLWVALRPFGERGAADGIPTCGA